MKKWIYFLWLFSLSVFATLTMEVDTRQVGLGDTFTLTLISDAPEMQTQPNLNLIEKNFSILTAAHRMQYNIINSVTKIHNEWSFTLLPKHTGHFTIPPLHVGKETAGNSITIEVTPSTSRHHTPPHLQQDIITHDEDLFIKTISAPNTVYVNQQIRYTVQVYSRRHLLDVAYTPPQAANSLIFSLNQSVQNEVMIAGKRYEVETLHYAIFPSQSGKLIIHPPELKGLIYDILPQPIHVRGQPIEIEVKAAPTHMQHFLPASALTLSETFEPQTSQIQSGTPIIRIITIQGKGVLAALLPSLSLSGKGYTVYPTPPEEKNLQSDKGITGTAVHKITYLFNEAGSWTLPAIEIAWFNTITEQPEITTLPAHTFTVTGTAAQQSSTQPRKRALTTTGHAPIYWPYLMIGILILIIFLLSMLLYRKRKHAIPTPTTPCEPTPSLKAAKHALKTACDKNKPQAAEQALLQWAKIKWPKIKFLHLQHLAEYCQDQTLVQAIQHLIESRYSQNKTWDGRLLWQAFEAYHQPHMKQNKSSHLPDLNPK